MNAGTVAIIAGIVAVVAFLGALAVLWWFNRQLDPPEFTGDQGIDP